MLPPPRSHFHPTAPYLDAIKSAAALNRSA
jgi:hypothetical protein